MGIDTTEIFIKYIEMYGFDKEKSKQFLELNSSPKDSVSRRLGNGYLLSDMACEEGLNKYQITGACGHVCESGIFLFDNDIKKPAIKTFDAIIGNGYSNEYLYLFDNMSSRIKKYIGFSSNSKKYTQLQIDNFTRLIKVINKCTIAKYELVISNIDDTICGIITKRK